MVLFRPTTDVGVQVAQGEPEFRVTLVYADPPGTVTASRHVINDLSLKVTSPSGSDYWGNCGLHEEPVSSSECTSANYPFPSDPTTEVLDNVQNVFIANPEAGVWNVTIEANEINQDGHVETPAIDADFALVVAGVSEIVGACCRPLGGCLNTTESACPPLLGNWHSDGTCATVFCPSIE